MIAASADRICDAVSRLGSESAFEVLARARALEATGRRVVHMEIGEPDFDTPEHIKEAAIRAIRDNYSHYTPSAGIPELRECIAEYDAVPVGRVVGARALFAPQTLSLPRVQSRSSGTRCARCWVPATS